MPYIKSSLRADACNIPEDQGQLCYALTRLCQNYLRARKESFATYGEIRNAIMSSWDVHFYPKLLKYESKKRKQNGDVK
jgi:hypothetical protein